MKKTFFKLFQVEWKLSLRDMNMVLFALIMPEVILIILGMIYGNKPAVPGASYTFLEQSLGALCNIAICAGGTMGLPILVSDYRERKILKRFQASPVSPTMILMVHLGIYSLYSFLSMALLFVTAILFFGVSLHGSVLLFVLSWLLTLFATLSIGMLVGGVSKNSKQASVIACILYFPMLIFSGATLPFELMPKALQTVSCLMPLTHGVKLLKAASIGVSTDSALLSVLLLLATGCVCTFCSIRFFRWE